MSDKPQEGIPQGGTDFSTLVITLSTSALLYLGEIPDPETNAPAVNLPLARHSIDILSMLREKTKGNLTPQESQILDGFLYDLRMKFVARSGSKG
jgi:hypothetical protein